VSDDYNLYVDEDGQVQTTLTKNENREFLTWLHELWEEGLLDTDGFTTADSLRAITDSDATITYGLMLAPTPLSLVPSSALDQYELLMPLTYNGKQTYRDLLGDLVRGTFAVTSACEDPGTVLSWVDYLYTEEGCHLMQAGEEGVDYQFNNDGTWNWIPSNEEVTASVLPDKTIADGGTQPGLSSVSFQLAFDQKETKTIITQLAKLKEVSAQPMPLVTMNKTQSERVSAIQADLGYYAEVTMTRFVTGDISLNDDTWQEFCQTVHDKGIDELISIWQEAIQ
jgi:putative aldouronate transport system substrate-binding protein